MRVRKLPGVARFGGAPAHLAVLSEQERQESCAHAQVELKSPRGEREEFLSLVSSLSRERAA